MLLPVIVPNSSGKYQRFPEEYADGVCRAGEYAPEELKVSFTGLIQQNGTAGKESGKTI